ncbi:hypothetical protein J4450_02265 [Candidatus Micrarchaeota archaeon]|nr:hypothetical protein [Candidatus Micrarchaeota archaeon]
MRIEIAKLLIFAILLIGISFSVTIFTVREAELASGTLTIQTSVSCPTGDLKIKVTSRLPVMDAYLTLLDSTGNILAIKKTGSNGETVFTGLSIGTYYIKAAKDNYYSTTETINYGSGSLFCRRLLAAGTITRTPLPTTKLNITEVIRKTTIKSTSPEPAPAPTKKPTPTPAPVRKTTDTSTIKRTVPTPTPSPTPAPVDITKITPKITQTPSPSPQPSSQPIVKREIPKTDTTVVRRAPTTDTTSNKRTPVTETPTNIPDIPRPTLTEIKPLTIDTGIQCPKGELEVKVTSIGDSVSEVEVTISKKIAGTAISVPKSTKTTSNSKVIFTKSEADLAEGNSYLIKAKGSGYTTQQTTISYGSGDLYCAPEISDVIKEVTRKPVPTDTGITEMPRTPTTEEPITDTTTETTVPVRPVIRGNLNIETTTTCKEITTQSSSGLTVSRSTTTLVPEKLIVTVKDGTGKTVRDASVQVDSQTGTTGSSGEAIFNEIAEGSYTIIATKTDYTTATKTIDYDKTLCPAGTVEGTTEKKLSIVDKVDCKSNLLLITVTDENQEPVDGATVRIPNLKTQKTDEKGQVIYNDLKVGNVYSASASKQTRDIKYIGASKTIKYECGIETIEEVGEKEEITIEEDVFCPGEHLIIKVLEGRKEKIPLDDVIVDVTSSEVPELVISRTTADGQTIFSELEPGNYLVKVKTVTGQTDEKKINYGSGKLSCERGRSEEITDEIPEEDEIESIDEEIIDEEYIDETTDDVDETISDDSGRGGHDNVRGDEERGPDRERGPDGERRGEDDTELPPSPETITPIAPKPISTTPQPASPEVQARYNLVVEPLGNQYIVTALKDKQPCLNCQVIVKFASGEEQKLKTDENGKLKIPANKGSYELQLLTDDNRIANSRTVSAELKTDDSGLGVKPFLNFSDPATRNTSLIVIIGVIVLVTVYLLLRGRGQKKEEVLDNL